MQKFIETQLQPHQQYAVRWIKAHESRPGFVGGFNMDEVGLGKTRETLGSINSNTLVVCPAVIVDVWAEEAVKSNWPGKVIIYNGSNRALCLEDLLGSTTDSPILVITSYSILVSDLKLLPQPAGSATASKKHKTTTNTLELSADYLAKRTFIFKYSWPRIVLDEAQSIRNQTSQTFKAVCALDGKIRWCITATPIYNHFEEFYTQIVFLKLTPWSVDPRAWKSDVVKPLEQNRPFNPELRRLILQRKKQDILRDLPPMHEHKIMLKLSPEERLLYDSIFDYGRAATKRLIDLMTSIQDLMTEQKDRVENRLKRKRRIWGVSTTENNWRSTDEDRLHWNMIRKRSGASIGTFILRLRQLCVAPIVVINAKTKFSARVANEEEGSGSDTEAGSTSTTSTSTDADILQNLNNLLAQVDLKNLDEDCPVCMEAKADRFSEPCLHQCCEDCWLKMAENSPAGRPVCPLCRQTVLSFCKRDQVKQNIVKSIQEIENPVVEPLRISPYANWNPLESTKFRWVAEHIARHERGYLVVSQWTTVLDAFNKYLETTMVGSTEPMPLRYDGSQSNELRTQIRLKFENDPNAPRGLLASLTSGSLGVTFIRASVVYFLDQWWNSPVDAQMAGRAHRFGQTQAVDIYYLNISDSIEDAMTIMRDEKNEIAKLVNVSETQQRSSNKQHDLTTKAKLVFKLNKVEDQN